MLNENIASAEQFEKRENGIKKLIGGALFIYLAYRYALN